MCAPVFSVLACAAALKRWQSSVPLDEKRERPTERGVGLETQRACGPIALGHCTGPGVRTTRWKPTLAFRTGGRCSPARLLSHRMVHTPPRLWRMPPRPADTPRRDHKKRPHQRVFTLLILIVCTRTSMALIV